MADQNKRRFLKQGLCGVGVYGVGALWSNLLLGGCSNNHQDLQLKPADANGVRLPVGFSSRIVARSGQAVVPGQSYLWHDAPDGGACFAIDNGGWIYVSNSEITDTGGASSLVFAADGTLTDAYSILKDTSRNCAGGATPWGHWLSCEEISAGRVWECDPKGRLPAIVRPALGVFNHEAIAFDEDTQQLYLTEDRSDGCLYRFTADQLTGEGYADLSSGLLEVAVIKESVASELNGAVLSWQEIPDPLAEMEETRYQIDPVAVFNGGEGIVYSQGKIIFVTKGDNRVWSYDLVSQRLGVIYDAQNSLTPILTGVDNVTVAQNGDIYVAEDGGDLQIVVIDNLGRLYPIAQLEGHEKSEVTGVAFSPDGKRLYFSSQRGTTGLSQNGLTYEIMGPF